MGSLREGGAGVALVQIRAVLSHWAEEFHKTQDTMIMVAPAIVVNMIVPKLSP